MAGRFSHGIKLVVLPALPFALEVAEIMFNQVFKYYGIPEDIVSNQSSFPGSEACSWRNWANCQVERLARRRNLADICVRIVQITKITGPGSFHG